MKRFKVNKAKSAKQFRHNVRHTKAANVQNTASGPMRGGWRL